MKGDFTRSTWRPEKHYNSVRMQQGRVQLDADWNEAVDIAAHRTHTGMLDMVGASGAPLPSAGFALVTDVEHLPEAQREAAARLLPLAPGDFIISAGRYYVDGVLCENESPVTYSAQPDSPGEPLPENEPATYLAYLDVWSRHLTALDDPEIREVALGGPDTTTRTKTVWQVRLHPLASTASERVLPAAITQKSTGRLSARAVPQSGPSDPCLIEPGAGYRRTENQLYRVEIHDAGPVGTATFKWSRDNGFIVMAVELIRETSSELTVISSGTPRSAGLQEGDCLEITDQGSELRGAPGQLLTLTKLQGSTLTLKPRDTSDAIDFSSYPSRPRLRKWDGVASVVVPSLNEGYIELESGVQVRFEEGAYATGDFWLVPARTATGSVEWPFTEPQPPAGIVHHYAVLGVLQFDGSQLPSIRDERDLFPTLTELDSLFYLSGDGQQAPPGQVVPQPLRVGVARGQWPVPGASVRFSVTGGSGTVQGARPSVVVTTDASGVATCVWKLDGTTPQQQVEATLLDNTGAVRHLPVRFAAALMTHQQEAGIHVEVIRLTGLALLTNDSDIAVQSITKGIDIVCDAPVDASSVSRATCIVTLELPYPISAADRALWGVQQLGYQPLVLAGTLSVTSNVIRWTPRPAVMTWLNETLFGLLKQNDLETRVLTRLTLLGNFIWQSEKPESLLDGDVFGTAAGRPPPRTLLSLPSGDGRRGGDLRMWFWLVEQPAEPK
jgi:hypothetical protein